MSESLFTSQTPTLTNVSEAQTVTVGITVVFAVAGSVGAARFYAPTTLGGTFEAALWSVDTDDVPAVSGTGTLLGSATFGTLTSGAWNTVSFSSPIAVAANTAYRISVRTSQGRYTATGAFFNSAALTSGNVSAPQTGTNPTGIGNLDNGSFIESITTYPNKTFNGNAYFVDVVFDASGGSTPITIADAGSAGQTFGVSAIGSFSDTASAGQSFTSTAAAPIADAGSAGQTFTASAATPIADTASAAESFSVVVTVNLADAGSGVDSADNGTGTPKSLADAGSASEALSVVALVGLADAAAAAQTFTAAAALALADAGSAVEALGASALLALADTGAAGQSLTASATLALADTGSASELFVGGIPAAAALPADLRSGDRAALGMSGSVSAAILTSRDGASA